MTTHASKPNRTRTYAAGAALLIAIAAAAGALAGGGNDKGHDTTITSSNGTTTVYRNAPSGGSSGKAGALSRNGFDPSALYRREAPGVVTILSVFGGSSLSDLLQGGGESGGLGSGFVLNDSGEIATNAHVVTDGTGKNLKRAREVYVEFADGNRVPAQIKGYDPNSDVALLKVNPSGLTIDPLPLGSSEKVDVGEPVAAMGSPFGEKQSLSVGVISAKDRDIDSLTAFTISGALQTDAAINKGNSGGPLLDANGRVLGINSQIRSESGDGTGVGFAVPVDLVRRVIKELRKTGHANYAYLGVSTKGIWPQAAAHFHLPTKTGAWVQTVSPGGPGDKGGMKAGDCKKPVQFQAEPWIPDGDVIVGLNGKSVKSPGDLSAAIALVTPGTTVPIEVYRGQSKKTLKVTLTERPVTSPSTGGC